MTDLLQHPYAQALARAILHFVWQGAVIGLVAAVLLRVLRLSPNARYLVGVVCLAAMLAAPAATTWSLAKASPVPATPAASTAQGNSTIGSDTAQATPASEVIQSNGLRTSLILALWLSGVSVLSIRLVGGWIVTRRVARRAVQLAAPEIQSLARQVAGRLALDRVVRVVESSTVAVPVMIGWVKPVVILPAAALAGLSPAQVEALLAHELAHVFRHDYLVNLLQAIVETVLFYHPAVWWVSREVRDAREQCCDDMAVGVCDRLVYATALAELAAMTAPPRLALAAADGSLVDRVRRILGQPPSAGTLRSGWAPASMFAVLIASLVSVVWSPSAHAANPQSVLSTGSPVQGVVGGVVGSVTQGIVGGVAGGVTEGVVGGVSSGVPGGVTGGVIEGVVGGVRVADDAPQDGRLKSKAEIVDANLAMLKLQIDDIKRRIDRARQMKELGEIVQDDIDKLQAVLRSLQLKLEAAASPDGYAKMADAQTGELKIEIEAAQKRVDEARRLVELGLASTTSLDEATLELRKLEILLKAHASGDALAKKQGDLDMANLEQMAAQREYERTRKLQEMGVTSSDALDQATLKLKRAELDVQRTKEIQSQDRRVELGPQAAALRDRVAGEGASMSDNAIIGVIKDAAKLASDVDRAEVLLAISRQITMTPDIVSQFVNAANTIQSVDQRARVFKMPIRLRQTIGKKEK